MRFSSERWLRWFHQGLPVGRIMGISVRVHSTLAVVALFYLAMALVPPQSLASVVNMAIFLSVLMVSVLLHELGHCWGAHRIGGSARSILLWPLGGIASIEGAQQSPYDEFVVVLMGPAVSLVLAVFFALVCWALPDTLALSASGALALEICRQLRAVNAMLFIFNMVVPLFPMDCARLIRSLASMKHTPETVTYNICLLGLFVGGLMAGLYFAGLIYSGPMQQRYGIFFLLIAVFGIQSCLIQLRILQYEEVYTNSWIEQVAWRSLPGRLMRTLGFASHPRPIVRMETIRDADEDRTAELISPRDALLSQLEEAVEREDFVRAAEVRDQLRNLKKTESHPS